MSGYNFALLVLSDSRSKNPKEDKIKPIVEEILKNINAKLIEYKVIPDEFELIKDTLVQFSDNSNIEAILTSGGTGLYERDVTPQATKEVLEYEIPFIPQAMLLNSLKYTKRAMLSRMVAGVRNKKLIINLPGSPKAVRENLEYIVDVLPHAIDKLNGDTTPCGT